MIYVLSQNMIAHHNPCYYPKIHTVVRWRGHSATRHTRRRVASAGHRALSLFDLFALKLVYIDQCSQSCKAQQPT